MSFGTVSTPELPIRINEASMLRPRSITRAIAVPTPGVMGRHGQPGWGAGTRAGLQQRVPHGMDLRRGSAPVTLKPSPLRDLQNAVPDEGGHQSGYHGAAENDKAENAPTHGIVPTMLNLRVKPSSSMSQCCPAFGRVNRDAPNHAPLSGMGQSADLLSQKQITRPPVDA
jgi:hypothetical protein